jgi:peptide/nickel transport system substrate-binding protein
MAGIFFFLTAAAYGDAFVTASIGEPSNLIPFLASDSASAEVSRLIFNGLVKYDEHLKLTGDLAESWEILEGGLKIVFHLRRDVLWQDGTRFTAKDVEFTFKKLTDPQVPTPYSSSFEKVESLKVLDEFTLEIHYAEPFSPGLASWGMGIIPEHLLAGENLLSTKFARMPVGTGPYKLKKWVTGQFLTLSSNKNYFEGRPNIDRLVYRIIPDEATTFLELQTENLDTSSLTPLQYDRQIQTPFFKKNYISYRWTGQQYSYMGYNLTNSFFSDKRVRKAIGMAIDKQEIISATRLGHGKICTGPFLPDSWAFNFAVQPAGFNREAAKELLKDAGWEDHDGDGILDKNGIKFSFTLMTNQGNGERKMASEIIQKRLRDIGIEIKIQIMEWSVLLKEFIHPRRFEAVLLGWNLAVDPDLYGIFHSSRVAPGQFNFVSFKNEEVDRLLEEGRKVFEEEKRAPIYRRIHEIIAEEEPYTFLYTSEALVVLHSRFQGVTVTPLGIGYDFIRWYVPASKQKYGAELSSG